MNEKNKLKHSPTPFEMHQGEDYLHIYGGRYDDSEHPLARVANSKDAAFIVQACNAHEALEDALLAALPFVEDAIEECFKAHHVELIVKKIRAALKLAE